MCSSFKRVLTDEERQSLVASSTAPERQVRLFAIRHLAVHYICVCITSTPDDLAARLRSVGSRVRKHVMEGYTSPPPSFTKSNSTPTIFCSAHDTLREVYAPSNASSARVASERKRARPQGDQGYDSDGGIDEDRDAEMGLVNQESDEDGVSIIVGPDAKSLGRPIKALRKPRRAMLATRSLPATSFAFGNNRPNNESTMNTVKEEEDWSAGNFVAQSFEEAGVQDQPSSFGPMILS